MIAVDRAMIEDYHIQLIQMMENAGRNLAELARQRFLNGNAANKRALILAGTGGNGGGALVCARHLQNMGAEVYIAVSKPTVSFSGVPAHQLDILRHLGLPVQIGIAENDFPQLDLIVDGIIGYSLQGDPRGTAAQIIAFANDHAAPTLSLDIPSGLDSTTGTPYTPTIHAAATMTLALPKIGLQSKNAAPYVGELFLADISVPFQLYKHVLDLDVPADLFSQSSIIRLT